MVCLCVPQFYGYLFRLINYTIFEVLSKILKNAGSYSVLLVGIVITTFFQVYSKEKELEKEDRIKIGDGSYLCC